jgi:hypothetical protein
MRFINPLYQLLFCDFRSALFLCYVELLNLSICFQAVWYQWSLGCWTCVGKSKALAFSLLVSLISISWNWVKTRPRIWTLFFCFSKWNRERCFHVLVSGESYLQILGRHLGIFPALEEWLVHRNCITLLGNRVVFTS